jgi:hypothetical protein
LNPANLDEEAAQAVMADLNGEIRGKGSLIAPIMQQKNTLLERTKGMNDAEKFKVDVESRPAEVLYSCGL